MRFELLRAFTLACLFGLAPAPAYAQLDAWLLTMGVGDGLWERFGHTALRVSDGQNDVVYNFGAAPFTRPSFLWEFLRGEAEFRVVYSSYQKTVARYRGWDRTLSQQKLRLSPERTLWLARELASFATPPKNRYRYDHIHNNCATQIRDLLDVASDGALRRAGLGRQLGARTYRDDMLDGVRGHWAGHLGADLISGPYEDKRVPDGWVEMYLPFALRDAVAAARLSDGTPLAAPPELVYERVGAAPNLASPYSARRALVTATALISALVMLARRSRGPRALRRVAQLAAVALILLFSVFGLICMLLALFSTIPNLVPNYNAYLFVPFDLVFLRLTRGLWDGALPQMSAWLGRYLGLRSAVVLAIAALALGGWLAQDNLSFIVAASLYLGAMWALLLRRRQSDSDGELLRAR